VLLLNTDPREPFEVVPGARIAQLVVIAVELAVAVDVESLEASERGAGGFGSSGD
jgi:dUTP pyrophosphatase